MSVSDRQVHGSNHEAIHAALRDALFVHGHEAERGAKLCIPAQRIQLMSKNTHSFCFVNLYECDIAC